MTIAEIAACAGVTALTTVLLLPIHGASVTAPAPDAAEATPAEDGSLEPRGGLAWSRRFPNVELTTHLGQKVRFYDDLIKGKVVVINFMYATCTGS